MIHEGSQRTVSRRTIKVSTLGWSRTNVPPTISQVPNFFSRSHFRKQVRETRPWFYSLAVENSYVNAHTHTRKVASEKWKVFSWSLISGKHERCLAINADKNCSAGLLYRIDRNGGQQSAIYMFLGQKYIYIYIHYSLIRPI